MVKTFVDTYLYNSYPNYETNIIKFILNGEVIDTKSKEFEGILYDFKNRQVSSSMVKVLQSNKVKLITGGQPLSRQFKVIHCKDKKNNNTPTTFIDCNNLIYKEDGLYKCNDIDILISYTMNAMVTSIYYQADHILLGKSTMIKNMAIAFSKLFCHVVDYIYKISTVSSTKCRCKYLTYMYFYVNIIGKDKDDDALRNNARNFANISEREEELIRMMINSEEPYLNIKIFAQTLNDVLKVGKINVDIIVEKWMFLYGVSTAFGLELFTSFSAMLTDAYIGAYLNNQKTIEKIAGREMIDYTKEIIKLSKEVL